MQLGGCFFFQSASQIGTLETLIGRKSAILRRWLVRARCIPITCSCYVLFSVKKHEIMVLACQVGPFHLTLTQINSEMNCIAKNKFPDSQKLDMRRRGENFNACQEQRRVYFCILSLWFILCEARKASENLTFILKQSLILSNVFVVVGTRPIGDSTW